MVVLKRCYEVEVDCLMKKLEGKEIFEVYGVLFVLENVLLEKRG